MDIQNWFAIEAPREMSEAFAAITAVAAIAQTGAQCVAAVRQIEIRLDALSDPIEWFAASMYLEAVRERRTSGACWLVNW